MLSSRRSLPTPVASSEYPVAAVLIDKSPNSATPFVAVAVSGPRSGPPPGLLANATVTLPLKVVSDAPPNESSAVTVNPNCVARGDGRWRLRAPPPVDCPSSLRGQVGDQDVRLRRAQAGDPGHKSPDLHRNVPLPPPRRDVVEIAGGQ